MKLIIFISTLVSYGDAANILGVFLFPSESHHILGSILLGNLAKRGHNVTYISPFKIKTTYPNFTQIVVDDILTYKEEHLQENMQKESGHIGVIDRMRGVNGYGNIFFENMKIQWFLKSESKFDLMIHFAGFDVGLALAHHFDVPVIASSPFGGVFSVDEFIGNPTPRAYVPSAFFPFSDDMNFFQRLTNVLADVPLAFFIKIINLDTNEAIQNHLPGAPPIEEIQKRIEMVFVNSHVSIETPRPYLPAMVQIGGYHLQESEPLPEDLQKTMDGATNGIIYLSFGTNVKPSAIPRDKLDILVQTLGQLPQKVLIKFDEDTLDNKPDNVEIRKWYPQRGVLSHQNVKLFIGHGGYGGCTESLYYGVPMICIPFTLDQPKNCADVERRGYGIHLPLNQLTKEGLVEALQKVLHDDEFITKAKMKSDLYRDQEMNPMDKAAYWVNHIIKHKGAKHLRAKALDLSWYQYYLLDVITFIMGVILVILAILIYVLKCCIRILCGRKQKLKIN